MVQFQCPFEHSLLLTPRGNLLAGGGSNPFQCPFEHSLLLTQGILRKGECPACGFNARLSIRCF